MPTFKLSRRTALRGLLAGTAVSGGLPPLEAMFNANGTAYPAGGALPKRLGIFFWGHGGKLDRWNPMTTGPDCMPNVENRPLRPAQAYVSIDSGVAETPG